MKSDRSVPVKTRGPCKRAWEVEALVDGRLGDKDRGSIERHMETCAECTRSPARIRELGALLGETAPPARTEIDRRRARAELLTKANESIVGGAARRGPFERLLPALAFAAAAVLAAVGFLSYRTPGPAPVATAPMAPPPPPPFFEIIDGDHADYTTEKHAGVSRVTLRSGAATFHVEHVKPGARFIVSVPDGEVEVRGTRFVVDVDGGKTRAVVVHEGVVVVRVAEFDGVLRAGERWQASTPVPPALAPTAPAPTTPASAPAATVSASAPIGRAPALAGERFAHAMATFNAGDYGEADRAFVAFVRDFPADSRAEDAMFLVADARARRGDSSGAREAARAYLRRFPSGLRAPAAERLAADPH